ncbi:MAG: anaerobic ribonucleoside-triphosphate reductase activating protein [Christensenellaceae bacterium]|nr:anaerobic ribonucleoside-triphosphate reductase activating protein [Christensenellaceae bacterium]
MRVRLFGIEKSSIVDGPGIRFAVFMQGCPHACPGCHNPESHDFNGGYFSDTDEIISEFNKNPLLQGLTLSGGEPIMQPEASLVLASAAKDNNLDVWLYTGYVFEELLENKNDAVKELLNYLDVIVDGPFILKERSIDLLYCGSKNQRLIDVKKSISLGNTVLWEAPVW